MIIGGKYFDTEHRVFIMGILNVTPDSFSDGGRFHQLDQALRQGEAMIQQGADLIDVGGESTRPHHQPVSVQEEVDRVAPVLEALRKTFDIPLSLDTYKSAVVEAVLPYIDLVNDIWGLKADPNMAPLLARTGLPCCLMHNRPAHDYEDFWPDFLADIAEILRLADEAGIAREKIILDAGVGFQKTVEENLMVIHRTAALASFGCPVLLATSRKSVMGVVLDQPVDQRLWGTLATSAVGVMNGASFLRVHDVAENRDVAKMTKAIVQEGLWTAFK